MGIVALVSSTVIEFRIYIDEVDEASPTAAWFLLLPLVVVMRCRGGRCLAQLVLPLYRPHF